MHTFLCIPFLHPSFFCIPHSAYLFTYLFLHPFFCTRCIPHFFVAYVQTSYFFAYLIFLHKMVVLESMIEPIGVLFSRLDIEE